jgi:hypothetical protein
MINKPLRSQGWIAVNRITLLRKSIGKSGLSLSSVWVARVRWVVRVSHTRVTGSQVFSKSRSAPPENRTPDSPGTTQLAHRKIDRKSGLLLHRRWSTGESVSISLNSPDLTPSQSLSISRSHSLIYPSQSLCVRSARPRRTKKKKWRTRKKRRRKIRKKGTGYENYWRECGRFL